MKTAIVSGITGQIGSAFAELLLSKNYKIYGIKRRSSSINTERIDHLYQDPHVNNQLELVYGDLSDYSSIAGLVADVKPDFFYNFGAMSHVRVSFDVPEFCMDITGTGVIRCLEAIRKFSPKTRFLQMSSSEIFGSSPPPQNELTPFRPCSPYAIAKLAGYWATVNYRNAYNIHASNAICFNTESCKRGITFVTRKLSMGCAKIAVGLQNKLYLGNLNAKRSWSHVGDQINGIYLIANADRPDDYVLGVEEMHSVEEFAKCAFDRVGLNYKDYIELDCRYLRPYEVDALCPDTTKIKTELGWRPEKGFIDIVNEMVDYDLELAKQEKFCCSMHQN